MEIKKSNQELQSETKAVARLKAEEVHQRAQLLLIEAEHEKSRFATMEEKEAYDRNRTALEKEQTKRLSFEARLVYNIYVQLDSRQNPFRSWSKKVKEATPDLGSRTMLRMAIGIATSDHALRVILRGQLSRCILNMRIRWEAVKDSEIDLLDLKADMTSSLSRLAASLAHRSISLSCMKRILWRWLISSLSRCIEVWRIQIWEAKMGNGILTGIANIRLMSVMRCHLPHAREIIIRCMSIWRTSVDIHQVSATLQGAMHKNRVLEDEATANAMCELRRYEESKSLIDMEKNKVLIHVKRSAMRLLAAKIHTSSPTATPQYIISMWQRHSSENLRLKATHRENAVIRMCRVAVDFWLKKRSDVIQIWSCHMKCSATRDDLSKDASCRILLSCVRMILYKDGMRSGPYHLMSQALKHMQLNFIEAMVILTMEELDASENRR